MKELNLRTFALFPSALTVKRGKDNVIVTGFDKGEIEIGDRLFTNERNELERFEVISIKRRDAIGNFKNPEDAKNLFFEATCKSVFLAEETKP